jgi:hypothetical protein
LVEAPRRSAPPDVRFPPITDIPAERPQTTQSGHWLSPSLHSVPPLRSGAAAAIHMKFTSFPNRALVKLSGKRTYVITTWRVTLGEELKWRNGVADLRRRGMPRRAFSSLPAGAFALTAALLHRGSRTHTPVDRSALEPAAVRLRCRQSPAGLPIFTSTALSCLARAIIACTQAVMIAPLFAFVILFTSAANLASTSATVPDIRPR